MSIVSAQIIFNRHLVLLKTIKSMYVMKTAQCNLT